MVEPVGLLKCVTFSQGRAPCAPPSSRHSNPQPSDNEFNDLRWLNLKFATVMVGRSYSERAGSWSILYALARKHWTCYNTNMSTPRLNADTSVNNPKVACPDSLGAALGELMGALS